MTCAADERPFPPALKPLVAEFGRDVAMLGGYSSGTETRRGQRLLRAATAVWLPAGRMKMLTRRGLRTGIFGVQIAYLGGDASAFVSAVERLGMRGKVLLVR